MFPPWMPRMIYNFTELIPFVSKEGICTHWRTIVFLPLLSGDTDWNLTAISQTFGAKRPHLVTRRTLAWKFINNDFELVSPSYEDLDIIL